jgi:hypothetical protein
MSWKEKFRVFINKNAYLYYSCDPFQLKTSYHKTTITHSTLYLKKCNNFSDSLTHTTTSDTISATTTLRSSINLKTLHWTLAKARSRKQNNCRIRTIPRYHMHLHIAKSLINRQPGKTHYPHITIASYTHTSTSIRRYGRLASRTQTPHRQMYIKTTIHKCPTLGSNPTIGSQNNNETRKYNHKQSKKQKWNLLEHRADLLRIITLKVRGFQTS